MLPPFCSIRLGPLPDSLTLRKGRVQTPNVGVAVCGQAALSVRLCMLLAGDGTWRAIYLAASDERSQLLRLMPRRHFRRPRPLASVSSMTIANASNSD